MGRRWFSDLMMNNNLISYQYLPGNMWRYLGEFGNKERCHRTKVFVMFVHKLEDVWEESRRARRWFRIAEAQKVLRENKPNHAKYLDTLLQTQNNIEHSGENDYQ